MLALDCPNSIVLQFPEEVYKNVGSSVVLPQLLDAVDADKLTTVQFLQRGRVRLTFKDSACCDDLVAQGLLYGDVRLHVFRADSRVCSVYVRDLPSEVPDDDVTSFFSSFGDVLSIRRSTFPNFPSVYNGNRVVEVALAKDVPYFVSVSGFNCRAWYSRQPAQCTVCREFGHRAPSCPLSGLCRRCRQPGHMARECRRAWGDLRPGTQSLSSTVPAADDDDNDDVDYVPPPDEAASVPSDGEVEMASGDEEVVAQAAAPPPPRSTSSASAAPKSSVSTSKSKPPAPVSKPPVSVSPAPVSKPPASVSAPTSKPPAPVSKPPAPVSKPPAPASKPPASVSPASVSAPTSKPPAPVSKPPAPASKPPASVSPASVSASASKLPASVSKPSDSGSTASVPDPADSSRFPVKLCQFVEDRVGVVLASMPRDKVRNMSDAAIDQLARAIVEEYTVGDPMGFDCIVSFLHYSRRKYQKRALRESMEKESKEKDLKDLKGKT